MDGWYRFIINEHSLQLWNKGSNATTTYFLDLLDELPESEADNLLKTLEEKKQYYNMIYEEIRKKKAQNAS